MDKLYDHIKLLPRMKNEDEDILIYQGYMLENGGRQITYLSENFELITGIPLAILKENPEMLYSTIIPEDRIKLNEQEEYCRINGTLFDIELRTMLPSGDIRWIHNIAIPERRPDGRILWNGVQRDITKQKRQEQQVEKYMRELALLNRLNDIILETNSEKILLEKVCECLVMYGNYKLSWIGILPSNANVDQHVISIASYGEISYLNEINIDLNDPQLRMSKIVEAIKNKKTFVTNGLSNTDDYRPWFEKIKKHGIFSSLLIPFDVSDNNEFEALHIYSSNQNAFDKEEIIILERFANNLSLAIKNIRMRALKEEANKKLSERVKELDTLFLVNKILIKEDISLENTIQQIVDCLPQGWQYQDICKCRLKFDEYDISTEGYYQTPWSQKIDFSTEDFKEGFIEIIYTEEKPIANEGPFLKEERKLINTVAEKFILRYNKKSVNKALATSKANLLTIFENTDVMYLLMDTQFTILSLNKPAINQYYKIANQQVKVGMNFIDVLPIDRKTEMLKYLKEIQLHKVPFSFEAIFKVDNQSCYFTINLVPILSNYNIIGICVSAIDISKNKLLEIERLKITGDLVQRNRDLEQFAFIVSHNLRAPVANIIGLNNLLKEDMPKKDENEIIQKIHTSTKRLDEVITDLNDILQIKHEMTEVKVPIKLTNLLKNVIGTIKHIVKESKASITLNFEEANEINSIRSYLGSVFYNLITNSIKFTCEGVPAQICISTKYDQNNLIIEYTDKGLGIDLTKYRKNIFQMYQRFHLHIDGKGIGLFMVKNQVEVLGGTIDIQSQPNKGVAFTIILPRN